MQETFNKVKSFIGFLVVMIFLLIQPTIVFSYGSKRDFYPLASYGPWSAGDNGYLTGTVYSNGDFDNDIIEVGDPGALYKARRAWVEFGIEDIPDNAEIFHVQLDVYVYDAADDDEGKITKFAAPGSFYDSPKRLAEQNLGDELWLITGGDYGTYSRPWFAFGAVGWKMIGLGDDGVLYVQQSLPYDHFAVGLYKVDDTSPEAKLYGYSNSTYRPYLEVWFNVPPDTPSKPSGLTSGFINTPQTYSTSATDPDDEGDVRYGWDWGDGTAIEWSGYGSSGWTDSRSHSWSEGGTYNVKVKAQDAGGLESSWSPTLTVAINSPPNTPSKPSGPTSGSTGTSYTYSTSATDPDGESVKYGWDWNGDGTVDEWSGYGSSGWTDSRSHSWSEGGTYNVKVKAQDSYGQKSDWSPALGVTIVTINSPPYTPSSPYPLDGATNQSINADLSWSGGDPDAGDSVTYDVYFEANDSTPEVLVSNDQSGTSYDPGTLGYNTHYYWKIVATDNHGDSTSGPVWDFTTGSTPNNPPYTPSNPSPSDNATNQSVNVDLGWTGGDPDGDTVTYDVYFEPDDPTPEVLVSNDQSGTSYDPGTLNPNTHYYWKIIATDNHGESTGGPVWDFYTGSSPNNPPFTPGSPSPADNATNQSVNVDLGWSGGDPDAGDSVTYDVYFEANDSIPDQLVSNDQSGTSYDPGTLSYNTHYYWKIVATDNHGDSTSGPIWDFYTKSGGGQNDAESGGDAGNSFSSALLISPGTYNGYLDSSDIDDYYKFSVTSGQEITLTLTSPSGGDFDPHIYDPNGTFKKCSYTGATTETVTYTADSSGYWRGRINRFGGSGTYSFTVSFAGTQADLEVDPAYLDFGEIPKGETKTETFTISNSGEGTLSGTIETDRAWIDVDRISFNSNYVIVSVTVYTYDLEVWKTYTGTITVDSNGGIEIVSVSIIPTCVKSYPNPYSLSSGKPLTFWGTGVPHATIKIYTLSGKLVKILKETKGEDKITWDGRNEDGDRVVRGIYFFTTKNPREKNRGKFTVVR